MINVYTADEKPRRLGLEKAGQDKAPLIRPRGSLCDVPEPSPGCMNEFLLFGILGCHQYPSLA